MSVKPLDKRTAVFVHPEDPGIQKKTKNMIVASNIDLVCARWTFSLVFVRILRLFVNGWWKDFGFELWYCQVNLPFISCNGSFVSFSYYSLWLFQIC